MAIGDPNMATGTGAVAVGANNKAVRRRAGDRQHERRDRECGSRPGRERDGQRGERAAIGETATATAGGAIAIGPSATAAYANSAAIGAGAKATAANQVAIGVSGTTYVLPGLTSSASLAAQSGSTTL